MPQQAKLPMLSPLPNYLPPDVCFHKLNHPAGLYTWHSLLSDEEDTQDSAARYVVG